MRVTFKHPPVPDPKGLTKYSADPFIDFNTANPAHYPKEDEAGVYIYGLRLDIEGLGKKFVPLCVGETSNLKKRLFNDHYNSLKTNGNNGKEMFNWYDAKNLRKVQSVYTDMENYKESKVEHNSRLDNLIWYNHPTFFDLKLSLKIPNNSRYISGAGQMASVGLCGDLDRIYIVNGNHFKTFELKSKILLTKELFVNNFYFVYATDKDLKDQGNFTLTGTKSPNRRSVEDTVKQKLHKIGIFTTATANKNIKVLDVDLSQIQDDLINVSGHSYSNPSTNSLIL